MSSLTVGFLILGCVFGGALLGMVLRAVLLFEQTGSSISTPFLVIVVFWLSIIFVSFGLFAPRNATVIATLLICALSVSTAMFLILELDSPFHGLIQLSSAPLRNTLSLLGQ